MPLWAAMREIISCRCCTSVSTARATNVASAPSASESVRNGRATAPSGRRLGLHADLGRGRVLALGEPVDLVVEEQDLQIHVAAQHVDEVIAADRQRVAVAGDDPDRELRARELEPGRDRGRAPVDRVEPVRVHVVREARAAADARDEDDLLFAGCRAPASPSASARGSRSRRSPGTSAPPGRSRSPSCVSFA